MDGKFLNEMLASRDGQQVMANDCSSELIEYDVLHRSHLLFLQSNHHRHLFYVCNYIFYWAASQVTQSQNINTVSYSEIS